MPSRNRDREQQMAAMRRQGHTLQAIADQCGLTRERVRQILKRTGVTPPEKEPRLCPVCGETYQARKRQQHHNRECMMKSKRQNFTCSVCGVTFTVLKSYVAYRQRTGETVAMTCGTSCRSRHAWRLRRQKNGNCGGSNCR